MKVPAFVLIVSLAANGVLVGAFVAREVGRYRATSPRSGGGAVAAEDVSGGVRPSASSGTAASAAASRVVASGQAETLGILLRSGDGAELARVLRAAGVPEDMVRALVREQVQAGYRARIRAIEDAARGDRPWWQSSGRLELSAEQRAEIRGLQREMRAAVDRVLGPEDGQEGRGGTYAFLPPDKAEAARQVDADYADIARELRAKMEDFRLPSDRVALQLLEEERRADLAALLTPEEIFDLELRTSAVSHRLRREMGALVESEDEFRRLYQLAAAFDAQYGRNASAEVLSRGDRSVAESAFRQQVMDMLGPERGAIVARQRDPDYRTMQAATARLNLPSTATETVLESRARAATESQSIAADTSLDTAARRAALNEVAARVRADLQATLGGEGAEAFAQRARWLRALDRGEAFTVRPEGGVSIQGGRDGGRGGGG